MLKAESLLPNVLAPLAVKPNRLFLKKVRFFPFFALYEACRTHWYCGALTF